MQQAAARCGPVAPWPRTLSYRSTLHGGYPSVFGFVRVECRSQTGYSSKLESSAVKQGALCLHPEIHQVYHIAKHECHLWQYV